MPLPVATDRSISVLAIAPATDARVVGQPSWRPAGRTGGQAGGPAEPDDRTIVHVLNRLGFGAAPGDVERVRAMGLAHYIDQQLQPERIDDAAMTARLAAFETLTKSTRELAEDYFVPAQMARRELQRQQAAQDPAMTTRDDGAGRRRGREMTTPEQIEADAACERAGARPS